MTDVRDRSYPGPEHTVYMTPQELESFAKSVSWSGKVLEYSTPPSCQRFSNAAQRSSGPRHQPCDRPAQDRLPEDEAVPDPDRPGHPLQGPQKARRLQVPPEAAQAPPRFHRLSRRQHQNNPTAGAPRPGSRV